MQIEINDRKSAEEIFAREKERWNLIMQGSGDGMWDIDLENNTAIYRSPRLVEMSGLRVEGAVFIYDWINLFHPEDEDASSFFLNIFSEQNRVDSFQIDHRLILPNEDYRWFTTRGMLIRNQSNQKPSRIIAVTSDIQERKEREDLISHRATHDALTDLCNRLLYQEHLKSGIKYAERNKTHLAVIMVDIDNFKQINDTLGHDAGDALLIDVASRLRKSMRESDTVARIGGDEFAMLLAFGHNEWHGLTKAMDRTLNALRKPIWYNQKKLTITVSIGVSVCPEDGSDPTELLSRADEAMYAAKSAGRDTCAFWKPDQQHVLLNLKDSLENNGEIANQDNANS
jgi:diguanylate cyclase (GGDEF)-like protein/PAS domain S-box-containing protein